MRPTRREPSPRHAPVETRHRRLDKAATAVCAVLLIAPAWAIYRIGRTIDARLLVAAIVLVNVVTFLLYFVDKRRAQAGAWRVPESTLHLCALLGGWPAAFLAQRCFRHKTAKPGFQVVFWSIIAAHQFIAIDCCLDWRMSRSLLAVIP